MEQRMGVRYSHDTKDSNIIMKKYYVQLYDHRRKWTTVQQNISSSPTFHNFYPILPLHFPYIPHFKQPPSLSCPTAHPWWTHFPSIKSHFFYWPHVGLGGDFVYSSLNPVRADLVHSLSYLSSMFLGHLSHGLHNLSHAWHLSCFF